MFERSAELEQAACVNETGIYGVRKEVNFRNGQHLEISDNKFQIPWTNGQVGDGSKELRWRHRRTEGGG